MANNPNVVFKRKKYNPSTDSGVGVVVFDTEENVVYVNGVLFSSKVQDVVFEDELLSITRIDGTMTELNMNDYERKSHKVTAIDEYSTDEEYPSAKSVYDALGPIANDLGILLNGPAFANSLVEQGVVTPIPYVPSLVYAPEVITDTQSTTATLNPMKGNAVYIFTQPLTELNILEISSLYLETTIYFTTHATITFSYTFPQGLYKGSIIKFDKDCHYCMSIKDGVVILEKIDKYLNESVFLFSSEQLTDGVLRSRPDIVETSGNTPVIANTQPYTIYKFGEVTSLTMLNIPANTLETIAYFSAGSAPVSLTLSGIQPLKLTSGSVTTLVNGHFCIAIKDGVVVITELKEM